MGSWLRYPKKYKNVEESVIKDRLQNENDIFGRVWGKYHSHKKKRIKKGDKGVVENLSGKWWNKNVRLSLSDVKHTKMIILLMTKLNKSYFIPK